jgi:hypothetical protein
MFHKVCIRILRWIIWYSNTQKNRLSPPRISVTHVTCCQSPPRISVTHVTCCQSPPRISVTHVICCQSPPRISVTHVTCCQSPPIINVTHVTCCQSPPKISVTHVTCVYTHFDLLLSYLSHVLLKQIMGLTYNYYTWFLHAFTMFTKS